jgi:hypothetical protein
MPRSRSRVAGQPAPPPARAVRRPLRAMRKGLARWHRSRCSRNDAREGPLRFLALIVSALSDSTPATGSPASGRGVLASFPGTTPGVVGPCREPLKERYGHA